MNFFEHPILHFILDMSTLWAGIAIIFTIATFTLAHFTDKASWAFYTVLSALTSTIIALMLYSVIFLHVDWPSHAFVVFLMITGSFALIGFYVLVFLSKPYTSTYQTDQKNFQNFFQTLYDDRKTNIASLIGLGLFMLFFMANLFYQPGIKLFDEIFAIDLASCNHSLIYSHFGWQYRFLPFAMQEFNLISHIFNKLDCSYYFLYSLTFIQGLLTLFLLYKIIPFQQFWQKILIVLFIACQSFFIQVMITFKLSERNLLFLCVLMLYAIIRFYQKQQTVYLILTLFIANFMLYLKDPAFLFVAGFALTSLIMRMVADKIYIRIAVSRPIAFIRQNPLEMGLLFSVSIFVLIYIIYTSIIGLADISYSPSDKNIFERLKDTLAAYPFLGLFFIMPILYLRDYQNLSKHKFSLMLYIGALLYAMVTIFLKLLILGYYYSLAHLGLILSVCFYVQTQKQLGCRLTRPLKYLLIILLVVNFIFVVKQTEHTLRTLYIIKEEISGQKIAIKDALSATKSRPIKIFYSYTDRNLTNSHHAVRLIQIANDKNIPIILYNYLACKDIYIPKNATCVQTDNPIFDDYDIIILYRELIPADEWRLLNAQYGERIKQITHFSKYLRAEEHHNIYMIQN